MKKETFYKAQELDNLENELSHSIHLVENDKGNNSAAKPLNVLLTGDAYEKLKASVLKHLKGELSKTKKQFENLK